MNSNLYTLFESRFSAHTSKPFLSIPDGSRISYRELADHSAKLANKLSQLSIKAGDRIMVQTPKTPQTVILYLACLRIGAVYIPLNNAYTTDELSYFAADATPAIFVCHPRTVEQTQHLDSFADIQHILTIDENGRGTCFEDIERFENKFETINSAPNDLAAILYTSGTTGRSKGAMLSHENLTANALTLHKIWGWQDNDVLLHALPIFHVHGLFVALHCALLNVSTIIFLEKFDTELINHCLPKASVLMGVPTFYSRLLKSPNLNKEICKNIRLFISGSAPLLESVFAKFEQRTGHKILERYGMTEAGMITSNPLEGDRIAGTVGFCLPGVTARVANENGAIVKHNEKGVLQIKGPNVFQGYWQMPDKTANEFTDDGFFITGDIATMTQDGRVTIVGRAKDLIITGGYNVYPKEIELLVDELAGVQESAVIGLPHADFGEAVTALIVRHDMDLNEKQVIERLKGKLAKFKQPKSIIFVDELPRNTMGKVQKNQLREKYAGFFTTQDN